MKTLVIFCAIIASTALAFSQPQLSTVFEARYADLPFDLRIENSGIYGVASFDVVENDVLMSTYDSPKIFRYRSGVLQKTSEGTKIGADVLSGMPTAELDGSTISQYTTLKKSFVSGGRRMFADRGGLLTNSNNESITLRVVDRTLAFVRYALDSYRADFELRFPATLAYADLVGIDAHGNSFILVETYESEIPLKVKREVYTLNLKGEVLSILEIPSIKYCTTVKDFQIDGDGNLYHLLTTREKLLVLKWAGLAGSKLGRLQYPAEYGYSLHFNDVVPATEPAHDAVGKVLTPAVRSQALHIGETYVLHEYSCAAMNLSPTDKTAPDGDIVRTPSWLIVGRNARVAYMWGGFNSVSQIDAGLLSGKYAGDINTAGVTSYSVGVDCSGFVSRCWQMTYHSSTADMPGITTQYSSWDSLKPGDAIHKVGHVRLFVEKTLNGALKVVESSGRDWGVSYWTYTPSDLNGVYTPRSYNGMTIDFSTQRPELTSVVTTDSTARLSWQCDTANVLGYRLYVSADASTWSLLADESSLSGSSAEVALKGKAQYYRISSILNNGSKSESNWSNAMGASNVPASKKYLIVDGFERENASWRGTGNCFPARYGASVSKLGSSFGTIKNSRLIAGAGTLNGYDGVIWILGDEGVQTETFSANEQTLVRDYLEKGGKLFVSGSEIGWDLSNQGTANDKDFYANYLKAAFISDNAGAGSVVAVSGEALAGCNFTIGQTYAEDFPDEIAASGGSMLCMSYSNGKGAGVQYTGKFGSSSTPGKLVHLSFALETTANDSAFDAVIGSSIRFFESAPAGVADLRALPNNFALGQNYPNPFNPKTDLRFTIANLQFVELKVFDILGREVATLVNEQMAPGIYDVQWDASRYPSGTYFYTMRAGRFVETKRMMLVK